MVLRARERHDARTVDHGDEARFLADKKILDDDGRARLPELPLAQHAIERGFSLRERRRDDDALAGREPVRLDDDRRSFGGDVVTCCLEVRECPICRRRDLVPREKRLREGFRALELSAGGARAEALEAGRLEAIDDAADERQLGAYDGQSDALFLGRIDERREIGYCDRQIARFRFSSRARVAGRA